MSSQGYINSIIHEIQVAEGIHLSDASRYHIKRVVMDAIARETRTVMKERDSWKEHALRDSKPEDIEPKTEVVLTLSSDESQLDLSSNFRTMEATKKRYEEGYIEPIYIDIEEGYSSDISRQSSGIELTIEQAEELVQSLKNMVAYFKN